MKPFKITLDVGGITICAIWLVGLLSITLAIGDYQGKWRTIEAYNEAQIIRTTKPSINDPEVMIEKIIVSVPHPTLPDDPSFTVADPKGLLRQLKNPTNLMQRIFAFYPDLQINIPRPIRVKQEKAPEPNRPPNPSARPWIVMAF